MEDGLAGLTLFADERHLFPSELISPYVGCGWGTPSEPKHVVSYQLNVIKCPNLSKDNYCEIHANRPLACQAFPLRLEGREPHVVNPDECAFMEGVEKKMSSLKHLRIKEPEILIRRELQAINKINSWIDNYLRNYPVDSQVMWMFDLKSREWHVASIVI
jgi:Fe-S-cluster containining protein